MFCPNCEVEYRAGFTRCSDCDVPLVAELPKATPAEMKGDVQPVWEGSDEQECVRVCQELREAGIGYEVSRKEESRWMKLSVTWKYEINVPTADYEDAKKIAEGHKQPEMGEDGEASAAVELPDNDVEDNESEDESEELRETSYTENWYPEDATVEICEQKDASVCSMIEASLTENSIHFRADEAEDGTKKFSVLPEDERKARAIVREIIEGAPL